MLGTHTRAYQKHVSEVQALLGRELSPLEDTACFRHWGYGTGSAAAFARRLSNKGSKYFCDKVCNECKEVKLVVQEIKGNYICSNCRREIQELEEIDRKLGVTR